MAQSSRWVFTLNNYEEADVDRLLELDTKYIVIGKETGDSGTPHLQGFVIFRSAKRFAAVKALISDRAHLEPARGTSPQAAEYCKKDGDFSEQGECPTAGKRSDWDEVRAWAGGLSHPPPKRLLLQRFPGLYARYSSRLQEIVHAHLPQPVLTTSSPRGGWQADLAERLVQDPSERAIDFLVDPGGGIGKTWFAQYLISKYPDDVQLFRPAKRDDLAHAIDPTKKIYVFDIPRGQMEYFQYSIVESLKDRTVFSPKYTSQLKVLTHLPHVLVFSNEEPDLEKLTSDRYNFIAID